MDEKKNTSKAEINSVEYKIGQELVRGKPVSPLVTGITALISIPAFALLAAPTYLIMINKKISQYVVSFVLPTVMMSMDKAIRNVKMELLKDIKGKVLDVGAADGQWLKYYKSRAEYIDEVIALEPNPNLRSSLLQSASKSAPLKVRVETKFTSDLLNEESNSFDYVVLGNVLCEVPDQSQVLNEVYQLLKPNGLCVFVEHVREPENSIYATLQDWINPWWKVVSDGCNCNRNTLSEIQKLPWNVKSWEVRGGGPPIVRRLVVGIAQKNDDSNNSSQQSSL